MLNANTWAFSSGPHFIAQRRSDRDSPLQTTTDTATHHHHRVVCTRARYIKYTRICVTNKHIHREYAERERERERERDILLSRVRMRRGNGPRNFSGWLTRRDPRYSSAIVRFRAYTCPSANPRPPRVSTQRATRRALSAAPASAPTDTYSLCFDLRRRAMRRTSIHVYIHIRSSRFKMFACTARLIK